MEVTLTGRLLVSGDNRTVLEGRDFPGRQGRIVFAVLATSSEPVSRDFLVEVVWPGAAPRSVYRDLSAIVSKLRRLLGRLGLVGAHALRADGGAYQLCLGPRAVIDVETARRGLADAESALRSGEGRRAADAALAVAELARRPFLPGEDGEWVLRQRAAWEELLVAALDVAAAEAEATTAVRCAEEALALRPLLEASHLRLMRAHLRAGSRAEALRVHARCRELLAAELGVDPCPEIETVYLEALRLGTGPDPSARPPLPAWLSGGRKGAFVGRRGALNRLGGMRGGTVGPHLAYVIGDPGIGKTRLATEVAVVAYDAGAVVLFGRCDEDRVVPYQPFVEALRHVVATLPAGVVRALTDGWAADLSRVVPQLGERPTGPDSTTRAAEHSRYRLFDGVAATLVALSRVGPLVLVIDDVQWADRPTLALLRHVMRGVERAPLLVVATCRDADVDADHPLTALLADLHREELVTVVEVDNLDQAEVGAMLGPRGELAGEVHRLTAGNPFFVRQLIRHLDETGRDDLARVEVPAGVSELVRRRLSMLDDNAWRTLTVAAVAGRRFGVELLAMVAGLPEVSVLDTLDGAVGARLVHELPDPIEFAFVHDLVREALYRQLGATRRALLHRGVAEALESLAPDSVVELARHYCAAGPAVSAQAVRYAVAAAEVATAQFAHEDAARHYGMALAALPGGADASQHGTLLLALGHAKARAGDPSARHAFEEAAAAARRAHGPELLAGAALGLSATWAATGTADDERIDLLEQALTAVGPAPSAHRARLLSALASAHYWDTDMHLRRTLSAEAVGIARGLGDAATLANCLEARNSALWGPGDTATRRVAATEVVELAGRDGDRELALRGHAWGITTALELADRTGLDDALAAYSTLADTLRQPRHQWYARSRLATRAILSGDYAGGGRLAQAGRDIAIRAGEPDADNVYLATMYPIWLERLDHGAYGCFAAATSSATSPRVAKTLGCARLLWDSTIASDDRAYRQNLRALGDPIAQPRDLHWTFNVACLAAAAARQPAAPRTHAERVFAALRPHADTGIVWAGAVAFFGSASHWLGALATSLGRWQQAEGHLAAAADFHERLGSPTWVARTRFEQAKLLIATGHPVAARSRVDDAGEIARQLGMVALAADLAALRSSWR